MARKQTNVGGQTGQKNIPLSEIGQGQDIEKVSENDFVEEVELEAFMHDILTILVHETDKEGELDIICPTVGRTNQPIVRGIETKVKRKYVEALARCRVTTYTQSQPDATRPDKIIMREKTVIRYPFSVLHDPNPKGPDWLKGIINEH